MISHASGSDDALALAYVVENKGVVEGVADVAEDELMMPGEEGDEGHVYTTVPPWSRTGPLGRLATFPDSWPTARLSVPCRRYINLACSVVRMGAAHTDEKPCPDGCSRGRRSRAGRPRRNGEPRGATTWPSFAMQREASRSDVACVGDEAERAKLAAIGRPPLP